MLPENKVGVAGSFPASHVIRELEHPERKLTLLMIGTALIFAFIGTILGALTLAHISGFPTDLGLGFFPSHPFLQIYGFLAEFVIGVAYSLLPRFKMKRVPALILGYLIYVFISCANVLFLLSPTLGPNNVLTQSFGALLVLVGSIMFTFQVTSLAFHAGGGFPETNPLIALSSVSLVLISLAALLELGGLGSGEVFSTRLILLALLGFAGSMIYTVEIRSVSFRQCNYRKWFANLVWKLQSAGVAVTFVGIFLPLGFLLSVFGGILFLAAALCVILSIKIFELAHPLMYRPAMTKMHFTIVRYNEVCILFGSFWLLFGCALSIILLGGFQISTAFFFRDSFIHSVAIGFIGSTITLFAPMLLPALLGKKAPVTGLSFGPILLLNSGIIVRVVGDSATFVSSLPVWESVSGPLILGAMIWLLIVLTRVGSAKPVLRSADNSLGHGIKNARDCMLTLTQVETKHPITLNVWFVEKDGDIYLLPRKGAAKTKWYQYTLVNPDVNLVINDHTLSGRARNLAEKTEAKSVIKLFKDKYGDRVYRNFYGDRPDCAVKVTVEKHNS